MAPYRMNRIFGKAKRRKVSAFPIKMYFQVSSLKRLDSPALLLTKMKNKIQSPNCSDCKKCLFAPIRSASGSVFPLAGLKRGWASNSQNSPIQAELGWGIVGVGSPHPVFKPAKV
uniref:Uncharacterized protein n=1 Tax=Micrurus spixii TaxID=129469 RepID=A0A2D4MTA2_9SAUR